MQDGARFRPVAALTVREPVAGHEWTVAAGDEPTLEVEGAFVPALRWLAARDGAAFSFAELLQASALDRDNVAALIDHLADASLVVARLP